MCHNQSFIGSPVCNRVLAIDHYLPMESSMKINQSVALVSGANRGIGLAFVEALLEMGATRVYATAPDLATLEPVARLDRTRVRTIKLDVRDPADSRAAVEEAKDVNLLIHRRRRVPRRTHTHGMFASPAYGAAILDRRRACRDITTFISNSI
jgi:NAD(P)-dependent dehydrogenase (short-subunit alcohol dehydrogenase family)